MKYYNSSKVNIFIKDLLLEDGGVTAVSPARRGNVGRPLPTPTSEIPKVTPPRNTARLTPGELNILAGGAKTPEELLSRLKRAYPELGLSFGTQEEPRKFFFPYQSGMFDVNGEPTPVSTEEPKTTNITEPEKVSTVGATDTSKIPTETPPQEDISKLRVIDPNRVETTTATDIENLPDSQRPSTEAIKDAAKRHTGSFTFNPKQSLKQNIDALRELGRFGAESPGKAAIGLGIGLGIPYIVAHLTGYGANKGMDYLQGIEGYDKDGRPIFREGRGGEDAAYWFFRGNPRYDESKKAFENPAPTPRDMIKSAAEWGAMETAIALLTQQGAAGTVAALGAGTLAGAAAPAAAYGGWEAGKLIGEKSGLHPNAEIAKLAEIEKERQKLSGGRLPSEYPNSMDISRLAEIERRLKELGAYEDSSEETPQRSDKGIARSYAGLGREDDALVAERNALRNRILQRPVAKDEQEELNRRKQLADIAMQRAEKSKEAAKNTAEMEERERKQDEYDFTNFGVTKGQKSRADELERRKQTEAEIKKSDLTDEEKVELYKALGPMKTIEVDKTKEEIDNMSPDEYREYMKKEVQKALEKFKSK